MVRLLYAVSAAIATVILNQLPVRLRRRICFHRDLAISISNLVIGRLLPELPIPKVDLSGQTVIVTGANSAIGLQIALQCARLGANVCLACRNKTKSRDAVNHIVRRVPHAHGRVYAAQLDTSDLGSVKSFAETWASCEPDKTIDILFHNAGIASTPKDSAWTEDGFDVMYTTNLLGPFLLTYLLEPYLSPCARVVFTTSTGQYGASFNPGFSTVQVRGAGEPGYHYASRIIRNGTSLDNNSDESRYSQTKSMQVIFAKLLQRRFDGQAARAIADEAPRIGQDDKGRRTDVERRPRRVAHSFTPGFTGTAIFNKVPDSGGYFWNDPTPFFVLLRKTQYHLATDVSQGAMTGVWLGASDDLQVLGEGNGGGYWDRMVRRMSQADMMDEKMFDRFWKRWQSDAGIEWT